MKTIIKYAICFGLILILCAAAIWGWWYSTSKPTPDPLARWHFSLQNPDQVIEKDYHDYIQNLPPNQKGYVDTTHFFEDGTGQHAIRIEVFEGNKNASWQHVLIYDKDDKRIKVIRYYYGKYQS